MSRSLIIFFYIGISMAFFTLVWGETDVEQCTKTFVTEDYTFAYPACLKAAEQGDIGAQYSLGEMCYYGNGVKQDYAEALSWYRKAAEQGLARAQSSLGSMYFNGKGVSKDNTQAAIWYRRAAEQGDAFAQLWLGLIYEFGWGVKQDHSESAAWYLKSAEKGNAGAQNFLGYLYRSGKGVKQDSVEAVKWFRSSAEQGTIDAQNQLGNMYYLGKGVPKNYSESVKWFRKAAEQGDESGQWNLGDAYQNGEGVQRDPVQALAWYTLAAASGKNKVVESRDNLEADLSPAEIFQAQQLAAKYQREIDQRKVGKENTAPTFPALSLPDPAKPAFTANDVAVIIGIEHYRTVPQTEYAAADAATMRDYLKALGFAERHIEFLSDERATLSDIRKVIESKLPNIVKISSRVIVYYAGYGASGTAKGESYLVPYDGDPSYLAATAYPLSRLYDRLSRLKAKEVLVVLDTCFSGAGGRSVQANGARPLVLVQDAAPPASKTLIVLTSARGNQITTTLPETGHGAFTYFFLRALQEGNRDIGEVFAYLNSRVADEAKRQNVEQTPTAYPSVEKLKGRFVFAK